MSATVIVVGLGNLGGPLLDRLASQPGIDRLIACGRSIERGTERVNLTRLVAQVEGGGGPAVEFRPLDLRDGGALSGLVEEVEPAVVVNTASLQTWWLLDLVPAAAARRLRRAGFGAWLPLHLALTVDFMREMEAVDFGGAVLTGSFPDVVNCVLARCGPAPTCGLGNLDEIVPKVQLLAGERLGAPPGEMDVTLVAHHALEEAAFAAAETEAATTREPGDTPPFFVSIEHDGRDVSDAVDAAALVLQAFPLSTGPAWGSLTAASAARLVRALLGTGRHRLHVPGPAGLPGGYPVAVGEGVVELIDIPGLPLEEAVAINESSHRFDGIDRIEEDGSVYLSDASRAILHEELAFSAEAYRPHDVVEQAAELSAKFAEWALGHGVDVARASALR